MLLKYQLHRIILITLNDTINIDSGQTMEREREGGKKGMSYSLLARTEMAAVRLIIQPLAP